MAIMSCLQKQDKAKNTGRYRVEKLPSFLSKMQTGNTNPCKTIKYNCYQRARRTDAEPITSKLKTCGSRLFL